MHTAVPRFVLLLALVLGVISQPADTSLAATNPPPKVATAAFAATINGNSADMLITVPGYPDLSPARSLRTKEEKTRFVYEALTYYADKAQAALRRDLESRRIPHQVLWISNSIFVPAMDRPTLLWLSTRADVAHIDLDVKSLGIQAMPQARLDSATNLFFADRWAVRSPQSVEWGVSKVNAPQVWAMGYMGQGVVIADLDTGVLWNHAALQSEYRGWNGITATHDYNWYDPTGKSINTPTDDNGHGTHTTGSIVGTDGGNNQIGVAPGSKWIACRNMNSGQGSVADYTMCFQFALAPTDVTGVNPNPALAADITSNSWACWGGSPWFEVGCSVPSALMIVTQVLHDAGIMVVAAAGNEGPGCDSVDHAPGTYDSVFSVGATDSNNNIASFSSRGPSTFSHNIKPNVVAPGVNVLSSLSTTNRTDYGWMSGTSMATPHVAGVAALLWSAAPWLRGDVDETEAVLTSTAQALTGGQTCGGVPGTSVPNNTFGYGLINAQAAVSDARAIVPQARVIPLQPVSLPFTFTYYVTNTSVLVRANVVLTASVPSSTVVAVISSGGVRIGSIISWSLGSIMPGQSTAVSLGVTPTIGGVVLSTYVASYDGIVSQRHVPGHDAIVMIYTMQLRLPFVIRS